MRLIKTATSSCHEFSSKLHVSVCKEQSLFAEMEQEHEQAGEGCILLGPFCFDGTLENPGSFGEEYLGVLGYLNHLDPHDSILPEPDLLRLLFAGFDVLEMGFAFKGHPSVHARVPGVCFQDLPCNVDKDSLGAPATISHDWLISGAPSYTILYYTILYYTILYYTILYYTILYYTILYYTIHYTLYTIRYTLNAIHYIHYTLYTIYAIHFIHYTILFSILPSILYTIYYILYTIYYILYTIYSTLLYSTILYYIILYYTILYYAILYYTILYYTILYYTILYYTILYYTTPVLMGLDP